jgi:hypothetical protein
VEEDEPFIIVIRFGTKGGAVDVIRLHQDVIKEKGQVLFAKIGRKIGAKRISAIDERLKQGKRTRIFLVGNKSAGGRVVFECEVVGIGRLVSEALKTQYMPPYYRQQNVDRVAGCWFMLRSIKERPSFKEGEFLISDGRSDLLFALQHSMTGSFIVVSGRRKSESA